MNNYILLPFIIVLNVLIIKILGLFISCALTHSFQPLKEIDYKEEAFIYISLFLLFFIINFAFLRSGIFENNSKSFVKHFFVIFVSIFVISSHSYILLPFYYVFKSKIGHSFIKEKLIEPFYFKYNIYIIETGDANAFATGIIPFSKAILLNRGIFDKVSNEGLKAIVAHEIGHLKLNHLQRLFFINTLLVSIIALANILLLLPHESSQYYVFYLMIFAGTFYGFIPMMVLGYFQKKYETQADTYAAQLVGKEAMIAALLDLNKASNGQMEKWSPNYPTLSQRISHVSNLSI